MRQGRRAVQKGTIVNALSTIALTYNSMLKHSQIRNIDLEYVLKKRFNSLPAGV